MQIEKFNNNECGGRYNNICFSKAGKVKIDYEYINPLGKDAVKYAENLANGLSLNNKTDFFITRNFQLKTMPDGISFVPTNKLIILAKRARKGLIERFKFIPSEKSKSFEINTQIGDEFFKELEQKALAKKSQSFLQVFMKILNEIKELNF